MKMFLLLFQTLAVDLFQITAFFFWFCFKPYLLAGRFLFQVDFN